MLSNGCCLMDVDHPDFMDVVFHDVTPNPVYFVVDVGIVLHMQESRIGQLNPPQIVNFDIRMKGAQVESLGEQEETFVRRMAPNENLLFATESPREDII